MIPRASDAPLANDVGTKKPYYGLPDDPDQSIMGLLAVVLFSSGIGMADQAEIGLDS